MCKYAAKIMLYNCTIDLIYRSVLLNVNSFLHVMSWHNFEKDVTKIIKSLYFNTFTAYDSSMNKVYNMKYRKTKYIDITKHTLTLRRGNL